MNDLDADQRLAWPKLLLYGLQWWAVAFPSIIISGTIVANLHYGDDPGVRLWYLRKLFAISGVMSVVQVLWGHRLPMVIGPATILMVGIIASLASGPEAIYTSIFLGGAAMAILGFAGVAGRLRALFTPRIVTVVLVLVSFTLVPTITGLVARENVFGHYVFAILLLFALVLANHLLRGVFKSLTVLCGLAFGTLFFGLVFGVPAPVSPDPADPAVAKALPLLVGFGFDPGTILAFAFCFLALMINETGSVEAVGSLLKAGNMEKRVRAGVGFTGVGNMATGLAGVIGSVDFSLSAGIIMATGCASRFPMIPMGLGLLLCAFLPGFVSFLSSVPDPVLGALLLYVMVSQLSSGLAFLVEKKAVFDFETGVVVGLPIMLALVAVYLPRELVMTFPATIRPVLGNGFVLGTVAALVLEHLVFGRRKRDFPGPGAAGKGGNRGKSGENGENGAC